MPYPLLQTQYNALYTEVKNLDTRPFVLDFHYKLQEIILARGIDLRRDDLFVKGAAMDAHWHEAVVPLAPQTAQFREYPFLITTPPSDRKFRY